MKAANTTQIINSVLIHPIEAIVKLDLAHDLAIVQYSRINAPSLLLGNCDTVRVGDTADVTGNLKRCIARSL